MADYACQKITYLSSGAASQALRRMTGRDRNRGNNTPYKCDWCGQWHLGRKNPALKRNVRMKRERDANFLEPRL